MKLPFFYQIHKISMVCPISLWANALLLALATKFSSYSYTNKLIFTISHYHTWNTHQLEQFNQASAWLSHPSEWMTFSDYPDSSQLRGQTNWCDISKDGHHQFLTCMYMHASPSLRWSLFPLPLNRAESMTALKFSTEGNWNDPVNSTSWAPNQQSALTASQVNELSWTFQPNQAPKRLQPQLSSHGAEESLYWSKSTHGIMKHNKMLAYGVVCYKAI